MLGNPDCLPRTGPLNSHTYLSDLLFELPNA